MASTSALLKSAASRKAAIQAEQNRIVDMEWSLSAKTADDYNTYVAHYQEIAKSARSTDALTYMNKVTSARKAYISNELQRSSINVLEGNATNDDKLNSLVGFYSQAVDAGDMDLAQSLRLQVDNLYQTIQTQKQASMNLATQAYNAGYTTAKDFIDDLKKGIVSPFADDQQLTARYINDKLVSEGPDLLSEEIQAASQKYGIPMASFEDITLYLADNTIANVTAYRDSYPVGSAEYKNLDNQVTEFKTKAVYDIPGMKISYDDLKAAADNVRAGLPSAITLKSTEKGYVFELNKVANWTTIPDGNGGYMLAPNYVSSGDVRFNESGTNTGTPSNNPAGGVGYTFVTQDIGGGQVNKYAMLPNGDLYDANGFNPLKPKGKIGNIKDYQNNELQQKYETPAAALQKLGIEADNTTITIDGAKYDYQVDDNGNVQYFKQLNDPTTGDKSMEVITIDTKTGAQHSSSADFLKYQQEQKRLADVISGPQTPQTMLQGQKNAGAVLQPSGASTMLQQAKNVTTANQMKTAQVQQAANAQQISQLPAQPLSVQPIPQAQPIKVQEIPKAQPLSVQPVPQAPSVSVYQAPITQGTTPKVVVDNKPNTTKVVVR